MGQKPQNALDTLVLKEDVLQICYWFQGEGFGDKFTAESVMPFLQTDTPTIDSVMKELVREGALDSDGEFFFLMTEGKEKPGLCFMRVSQSFNLGHTENAMLDAATVMKSVIMIITEAFKPK